MNQRPPTGYDQLTPALAQCIDTVCDRLEAASRAGRRPLLEEYLTEVPDAATVLLRELILVDVLYRRRAGEAVQPADYQGRFPALDTTWLAAAAAPPTLPVTLPIRQPSAGLPLPSVPGYTILGELGRGGMGVVYKAQDDRLGRLAALKFVLDPRCQSPEALDRFRREARTASALNHPHICTIYALEEHEGRPFLVMEFIEGRTLRTRVNQGPPLAQLLRWIGQAARALQAAHAAGVVHRDVKPENLLVRHDDVVKVLDFGVARLLPDGALKAQAPAGDNTAPGVLVGTMRYMAPEQARCEPVGGAADVFALGVVLYEMAAGRHPFEAASELDALHALMEQPPLSPSRLNPRLAGPLEGLMLRMLEKDPRRRPAAEEVDALLNELTQAGGGGQASPAPATGKSLTVGRRRELDELHRAFAAALTGRGLLACVTGEPGLGKTTLAESFLEELISRAVHSTGDGGAVPNGWPAPRPTCRFWRPWNACSTALGANPWPRP